MIIKKLIIYYLFTFTIMGFCLNPTIAIDFNSYITLLRSMNEINYIFGKIRNNENINKKEKNEVIRYELFYVKNSLKYLTSIQPPQEQKQIHKFLIQAEKYRQEYLELLLANKIKEAELTNIKMIKEAQKVRIKIPDNKKSK